MKIALSLLLCLACFCPVFSQTYISQQGKIHFHSSAPIEDIDAISEEGKCIINVSTKMVSAKVEMKSFVFPKPLMQQHFNDSYIESDKYPYAILNMKIINPVSFKQDGTYPVTLKGTFEIHGVKQTREIPGTLTIKGRQPYSASATFDVKLADHDIKIPTAVVMKIAEVIKVDVNFIFNKSSAK